ncbi:hypothetical protein MHAE_13288 [Mycobacterium haemophilum DSM 44634]
MCRQKFPDRPARIWSSVGAGLSRSNAVSDITTPGVQKPHCSPWHSHNADCTADKVPSGDSVSERSVDCDDLASGRDIDRPRDEPT